MLAVLAIRTSEEKVGRKLQAKSDICEGVETNGAMVEFDRL